MMHVNYLAVLIAAISNFVIGFLLHGPILGKLWMKLANVHPTGNEKLADMWPQMLNNFHRPHSATSNLPPAPRLGFGANNVMRNYT